MTNVLTTVHMDIYTQYGLSTKRNSSNAVGYMGVGVITATGKLLEGGYRVRMLNADQVITPKFSPTNGSAIETLKWYRKTRQTVRVNKDFTVRLEGLSRGIVTRALEGMLWLTPPAREDLIFEDPALGQLFRPSTRCGSNVYICHTRIQGFWYNDQKEQTGVNIYKSGSGEWLTNDRKGVKDWDPVKKRIAALWNKGAEGGSISVVRALWDTLRDHPNCWESTMISLLRPACLSLADYFRASNGGGEDVFPTKDSVGGTLYEALTSVMGTKADYMRKRLVGVYDTRL
jgi:hypothetical protein